jgi:transposase-like protein
MKQQQSIPKHLRYTLDQFKAEFPNDDACLEAIKEQRYPGGVTYCTECEQERKLYRVAHRPAYSCERGHHFYPLAGTIFEKTTTALHIWFYAMYQMGSTRCGISAKQIQRETGVTYKTAWRMFRQIRSLLSEPDMQLEGSLVEMDETYVGGRRHRKYQARRGRPSPLDTSKTCVIGAVERKGRVVAVVADDATKKTFDGVAEERILPKSTVFTDEHHSYTGLDKMGYEHKRVQHSAGVYVLGNIHTNTIEGFWSLVKRGIGGVYHSVGKHYLQTYLDEYSFRYNRRDQGNLIFTSILKRVSERASSLPFQATAETDLVSN